MFIKKAPAAQMFTVPNSYHELLFENDKTRQACLKVITDFFNQKSDDVSLVQPAFPLELYDPITPIYSLPEVIIRVSGIIVASIGIIAGIAMIIGDRK